MRHESWEPLISEEAAKPYWSEIRTAVLSDRLSGPVYPEQGRALAALETPLEEVRCVVLGQDPYHGPGQAHGYAFSVPAGVPPPPSLRVVLEEVRSCGYEARSGDLSVWAKRGVLLLNTVLTVRAGQAGSHRNIGWERFTSEVLRAVAGQQRPIAWLAWGAAAKRLILDLHRGRLVKVPDQPAWTCGDHLILAAPHPSPLAALGGASFAGCGHFRRVNEFLRERGSPEIDWST